MRSAPAQVKKYFQSLSDTPQQIAQIVDGIEEARLQYKQDAKSWSANEILAHLRACADLWTYSVYAILAENEPIISDLNERKWAKVTRYAELPFHNSFQIFVLQRKNLLHVLKDLPFESWERSAWILERKHTVFTQVRRMAKHESEHVNQLESMLREHDR